MTRSGSPDTVMLLDLRLADGRAYLEALNSHNADDLGVTSQVLVIDATEDLSHHHEWFQCLALLPQITGVILIAVGTIQESGLQPRLRPPSPLTGLGVTLWVGHDRGVLWQGGSRPPASGHGRMTLDDLVTALRLPSVFDEVLRLARAMPHQAASPGIEVDYAAVEPSVMRTLKIRALRQLTATGASARQHDRESVMLASLTAADAQGRSGAVGVRPRSTLHDARTNADNRIKAAGNAVSGLRGRRGLVSGRHAGDVVMERLVAAGTALREQYVVVERALGDLDSCLAEGYPPPTELVGRGLPAPAQVDAPELADALRDVFTAELAGGRTLPGLAEQARLLGNQLGSTQGMAAVGNPVPAGHDAIVLRLTSPPAFRLWPLPLVNVLPVVFLTCLAGAWLPRLGLAAGPLLAICWAAAAALLLARRPVAAGEGAQPTGVPLGVVVLLALAGCAAGVLCPPGPDVGSAAEAAIAVLLMLAVAVSAVVVWTKAAESWSRAVPVGQASALSRKLADHLEQAVDSQWTHAEHNRRLADSLFVIAAGLDATTEVLTDVIRYHHKDGSELAELVSVDTSTRLAEVLHHDLVAIALGVLRPCFEEIASRAPLSGDTRRFVHRAREMLSEYNDHLEYSGLRELPPGVTDDEPRRRLAATLWRGSDASRRILLSDGRSELTQLCLASELKLLRPDGAKMLHFASRDIDVLPGRGSGEVIRTGGNAVGALRLVPLKTGLVEWEVRVDDQRRSTGGGA